MLYTLVLQLQIFQKYMTVNLTTIKLIECKWLLRNKRIVFQNKTHQELALLETQIKKKIHSGEPSVDVEFLEFTLQHLHVHMAKARIHERHQEILQCRLRRIKEEQMAGREKHECEPEQICKQVILYFA